jgi:hypothetical protein
MQIEDKMSGAQLKERIEAALAQLDVTNRCPLKTTRYWED